MRQLTIKFKDAKKWLSVTGHVQRWDDYYQLSKRNRIYDDYVAPETVTDSWNGAEFDVQHKRWNAYSLSIIVREGEMQEFEKIRSTKDVQIIDNISAITHVPDTSLASYFEVSEPQRINGSPDVRYIIKYRTVPTYIHYNTEPASIRGLIVANQDSTSFLNKDIDADWAALLAAQDIQSLTHNTDFAFIQDNEDVERNSIENGDGVAIPVKSISSVTGRMLFFMDETDAKNLKRYGEIANAIRFIFETYGTYDYEVSEVNGTELTMLGIISELTFLPGQWLRIDVAGTTYDRQILSKNGSLKITINESLPVADGSVSYPAALQTYYDLQESLTVQKEQIAYKLYRCEVSGSIKTSVNYPQV